MTSNGREELDQTHTDFRGRQALTGERVTNMCLVHGNAASDLGRDDLDALVEDGRGPLPAASLEVLVEQTEVELPTDQQPVDLHHQLTLNRVGPRDLRGPLRQRQNRCELISGDQQRIGLRGDGFTSQRQQFLQLLKHALTGILGPIFHSTSSRHELSLSLVSTGCANE